jgi:uncharacterized protein (TIGR02145 family)
MSRGVCWSTGNTPTIADSKTTDGTGPGTFLSLITGLTDGTTYYVRAYATNDAGTGYGNTFSFATQNSSIIFNPDLTYGTVTDIDGNVYKTILIGTQTWMAENLKTTKYANGDLIGTTTPDTLDISGESAPKYQWAYDGNESIVALYGRLYTWYAITDTRNVCPTGWHVPSNEEWDTLGYLVGWDAGKLKETGTFHWQSPNDGATNETGFTALPGGFRYYSGSYLLNRSAGYWESSTEYFDYTGNRAYNIDIYNNDSTIYNKEEFNKRQGCSVRCLKDF